MPKLEYPTLITWTDPTGKTHVPPDPPLVKGYPSWWPRPNEYRRKVPLPRCPSLSCRRAKRCESLLYGEFCRKTHMEREEFRGALADKLEAYMKANNIPDGPINNDPPPPEMKRALQARQDEIEREELLKFQKGWIEEQKAKWANKAPLRPSATSPSKAEGGRTASPLPNALGEVPKRTASPFPNSLGKVPKGDGGLPTHKPAINPAVSRRTLTTH